MTFLFDSANEICLPATYDLAEEIEKFLKDTDLIAKLRAEVKTGESSSDKSKLAAKKLFFSLCKEYPKEVGRICDRLWILGDGEKAPNALITLSKVFTRKDCIDFFTSLMRLAQ